MMYLPTSNLLSIHAMKSPRLGIPQIYTLLKLKFTHVRDPAEANKVIFNSKLIVVVTTSAFNQRCQYF